MIKNGTGNILTGLRQKCKLMKNDANFSFIDSTIIYLLFMEDLKRSGVHLCNKYKNYLDKFELISELQKFSEPVYNLDENLKKSNIFYDEMYL
jgi:hypothetical protein